MIVDEILTSNPQTIRPDDMLYFAAQKMKRFDIGFLPVWDGEKVVGCLTDRDLVLRGVAEAMDMRQTQVDQIMTPRVFFCYAHQEIEEAAAIMEQERVRRLPVLNEKQ